MSIFDRFRLGKKPVEKILQSNLILDPEASAQSWAKPAYADYMAISPPAYRAITLRAAGVSAARPVVGRMVEKQGREIPDPEMPNKPDKPMEPSKAFGEDEPDENEQPADKQFIPVPETHPIQVLLDTVNDVYSRADLWTITEQDLCIYGTAYWLLERGEIWCLNPEKIEPVVQYDNRGLYGRIIGWKYSNEKGRQIDLSGTEVIRFVQHNPITKFAGLSPIAPVRLSLDMGHDALMFNRQFFANSAVPSDVAVVYPGVLADEEADAFYKRWEQRFRGANNAHRPILVSGQGADVKRIGISQRDMEFLAALNWTVEDAARAFGVPPPMMYSQAASIYNNVSEAHRDFWRSTIMSRWKFYESTLNEQLLPKLQGSEGLEIRFDYSDILPIQESMAEMNDQDRQDVQANILTINEVREKRGLKPVPWGDDGPPEPIPFGEPGEEGAEPSPFKRYRHPRFDRTLLAKRMSNSLERAERAFEGLQKRLFRQQSDAVVRQMAEGAPVSVAYNARHWVELFQREARPLYQKVYVAAAQNLINQHPRMKAIPKIPAWLPSSVQVQRWIDVRIGLWAESVNSETGRLLTQEINEANATGESIRQIMERVEKVFKFNDAIRAERIARTEMLSTTNAAHLETMKNMGAEQKEWLATRDNRVRDSHLAADGQVVDINEHFRVGNALLDGPGVGAGGMLGPAEETINCRCTVIPVVRELTTA